VYEAFKAHAQSPVAAEAGMEVLVKDIRNFARYFCAMALDAETDPDLKRAFHDLRELKVDPAYPFLLEMYQTTRLDSSRVGVRGLGAIDRGLRFPPGDLRHPAELPETGSLLTSPRCSKGPLP